MNRLTVTAYNVGFGDGFYVWRDPVDPDFLYSEYQGGEIKRLKLSTGAYPPKPNAHRLFF